MTSLHKAQEQWGRLRAQRAAKAYQAAMQPYGEAFSAPPAQEAALLVIGASMAFAAGEASRDEVTDTLGIASVVSGIPVEPWKAMSELEIFLAQLRQTKCSVITGGKK